MVHRLKTWPAYFDAVLVGLKRFEIRRDDRGFEVGDELALERWDPELEQYTGDRLRCRVVYILRDEGDGLDLGLVEGFVAMAIAPFAREVTLPGRIQEITIKGKLVT